MLPRLVGPSSTIFSISSLQGILVGVLVIIYSRRFHCWKEGAVRSTTVTIKYCCTRSTKCVIKKLPLQTKFITI